MMPLTEVARYLNDRGLRVSYQTLYQMSVSGKIPTHKDRDGPWARCHVEAEDLPQVVSAVLAEKIQPDAMPRVVAALLA